MRARKKNHLRLTKKQHDKIVSENKYKNKAHRRMIREALGFDKIKLKRREVEKNEFEKAFSEQIHTSGYLWVDIPQPNPTVNFTYTNNNNTYAIGHD